MNCKPGDLAVIVDGPKRVLGRLCTILHAARLGDNRAPDGTLHTFRENIPYWMIEVHGSRVDAVDSHGEAIALRYLVAPDYALRPIRDPGDDARDEMLRPLPKAEPAGVPA